MVLLITYDQDHIVRPERHQAVHEIVQMYADDYVRVMFTQWLVETDLPTTEWLEVVQSVIDFNDNILVTELSDDFAGFLHDDAWDWLRSRV
jgi:hypothetical protein